MAEFTTSEVHLHNKEGDLWIIRGNKVYDLTKYLADHPGGKALLRQAGKDATTAMLCVSAHGIAKSYIDRKLQECEIGTVKRNHLQ